MSRRSCLPSELQNSKDSNFLHKKEVFGKVCYDCLDVAAVSTDRPHGLGIEKTLLLIVLKKSITNVAEIFKP